MDNNEEFELKLLKIKKSLQKGDLGIIAIRAGVSIVTVQQMFKTKKFNELKPAMKLALDASINFTREKKRIADRELEKFLES